MNKILLKKGIQLGVQNLLRNKILSLATLAIITLIVFIFNIILIIHVITNSGIDELNKKVDIILYLKDNIDYLFIPKLTNDIQKYPEVEKVIYTSKEEALNTILQKFPDNTNPFEEYGIKNPLPASIRIISKNPEDHKTILDKIKQSDFAYYFTSLTSNDDNAKIVQKLIAITNFTRNLLITILISFAIGATMIVMNALHLTIQNRKNEIFIQQLVGADLSFIKLPFIVEGSLYGIIAGSLNSILIYAFSQKAGLFEIQIFSFSLYFYELIIWQFLACIAVSIFASVLAIHRYLNST